MVVWHKYEGITSVTEGRLIPVFFSLIISSAEKAKLCEDHACYRRWICCVYFILGLPELAIKPVYYVTRDDIGRIVLDKVTGLANGKQGPFVLQPLPCIVQAAWQ
jgi:hypothetical protein